VDTIPQSPGISFPEGLHDLHRPHTKSHFVHKMAEASFTVDPGCGDAFHAFKLKRKHKFVVFAIVEWVFTYFIDFVDTCKQCHLC
jgi:hypothetical protein